MRTEATTIDHAAVTRLRSEPIPFGTKGLPLAAAQLTLDSIAAAGWNVLAEDLPFPLLTLHDSSLEHNIETMAAYCRSHGLLFAPHGKTTMAPQIFGRQIDAGCWALTAATPTHLSVYRAFGVGRVFYANELVDRAGLEWLAAELVRDEDFEFFCLVDSKQGVARMDSVLREHALPQPVSVLVEVGHAQGRTGCRTETEALAVAEVVRATRTLRLVGVEAFEGTLPNAAAVRSFLDMFRSTIGALTAAGHFQADRDALVSVGGSEYVDAVVDMFAELTADHPNLHPLLRSGSYVTHDGGHYERRSPFGKHAAPDSPRLRQALELWALVQSRPQPDLAILGAGKRDVPTDLGPPQLTRTWNERHGFTYLDADASHMVGISDQHLHLLVSPDMDLAVGDLAACSISHPCTALDKWRVVPVVDDDLTVIDAILTFF